MPSRLLAGPRALAVLDALRNRRLRVVAAGKAAWPMAQALVAAGGVTIEEAIGAGPRTGGSAPHGFRWFDAGHPDPNESSVEAAHAALAAAGRTRPDERLLVLLSGGASALMAAPADGVTLADKLFTARALMRGGVAIDGLNCVRKHLSAVKGGRLAAAAHASTTLAISDVHAPIEDDPSVIGSGPTVPDPTTYRDAIAVIEDAGVAVPQTVRRRLEAGAAGKLEESIKPDDRRLARASWHLIGNRSDATEAARLAAVALGYTCIVFRQATIGEAREAAARFVLEATIAARSTANPTCVIASGETTVKVSGLGRGGRNQEFALASIEALARIDRPAALGSAGTDGADGPTDAAGAIVDGETLRRAGARGLDVAAALGDNDSYSFFSALDDVVVWGPTGTNVGDLQVMVFG